MDASDEYDRIMEAVYSGDIMVLDELARSEKGFPDGQDPWLGQHWLTHAIEGSSVKVVRWMLQNGASPIYHDPNSDTSLHAAIWLETEDRHALIRTLIEFGADIDAHGLTDYTPAHLAATRNDVEALRILHAAGADFSICTRIDDYATPLEEILHLGGRPEAVAFLLSQGLSE